VKKEDDSWQKDEFASLPLTTPPLFTEYPRGLLMLRLRQIVLAIKDKDDKKL
jgi:hypothetical protein